MEYHLIAGDSLGDVISFLPDSVQKNFSEGRGWLMIGQDEQGEILTVGAFQIKPEEPTIMELAYIFTMPDYREEGYALGLINAAGEIFAQNGITTISCLPMGEYEEIVEFTHFLLLCDFTPVLLDAHLYQYELSNLLKNKMLEPFFQTSSNHYRRLTRSEMKYYIDRTEQKLPQRFYKELLQDCDPEKSIFAIENGELMGAILLGERRNDRTELLNVYVNPDWKQKQQILIMLAQILKEIRKELNEIDIAIDDERVRSLLLHVLGNPVKDFWVQRYERALKEQ